MSEFRKFATQLEECEQRLKDIAPSTCKLNAIERRQAAARVTERTADAGDLGALGAKFGRRLEETEEHCDGAYLEAVAALRAKRDAAAAAAMEDEADVDEAAAERAAALGAEVAALEAQRPAYVSLKPRYGEGMRAKVAAALERLGELRETARELGEALEIDVARYEDEVALERGREAAAKASESERADAARAAALEAAAAGERRDEARRAAEAEAERARRAAADDIRRDRAARREARRRAEAAERTQDEEAARRWKKGVAAVEEALRDLRAACAEDSDYGGAVKALMNILGAIVEKPDDDARRKLRCANEAFARDVDRHGGGRACLFASGFILTHRSTAAPAPDGDEDDDWVTWESFLILREPDPLSDGFDAWTAWFDNVKACHERLCDEFQAIAEVAKAHAGGLLQGEMPAWASTRRSLY